MLLTPPSTLRALAAGYGPVLHPSAVELHHIDAVIPGALACASDPESRFEIPGSRFACPE